MTQRTVRAAGLPMRTPLATPPAIPYSGPSESGRITRPVAVIHKTR